MSKDDAKQKIEQLNKKYESLSEKDIKTFNEANTKQGFILPLFAALGWDIYETKEVTLEETASSGRVDFAFKLNEVAQFYIEAKKLNSDLNNQDFVKQAITYAYNNGVTWVMLTNFAELRLFNAQKNTPFITLSHNDYINKFDKLWLLSRESLAEGLLDKDAIDNGALPPLVPIEERLFKQLREWREELYNQLFHYNEWLKSEHRDEIIEKLFNRLIFIRTCEDRKLEEHKLLSTSRQWEKSGHKKGELFLALRNIFEYYRGYYDSDLFKEHLLDNQKLFIEETTISSIMNSLYDIPGGMASYDFSIIDADVLGRVYEQYLGYVASVVKAQVKEAQMKLSLGFSTETNYKLLEKKQHRKEQGIYYTPKFVTDYIVKETVGRFLKDHTFNDNLNVKILDPACGSGSFIIRAYDELLNYHANIKGKHSSQLNKHERLTILTRNIFGVDLDKQAVDIARLNLLLRSLAKRDLLPPLTDNIKKGNSLISCNENELEKYFGEDGQNKDIFIWENEFKDIIQNGGFDIIIGNPPYVRIQSLPENEADYYRTKYESAFGSFDIYVLFIEKAIKLLKNGGLLGFITSGKFLKSDYGKKIQQLIYEQCTVENVIDLSAQQVFKDATTYPIIMILRKGAEKRPLNYIFVSKEITQPPNISNMLPVKAEQNAITKGVWPLSTSNINLINKLNSYSIPLKDIAERIFQGLVTGADKIFILEKPIKLKDGKVKAYSRSLDKEVVIESLLLKPLLMGNEIGRYQVPESAKLLLFPYQIENNQAELISKLNFNESYPLCWQYLLDNRNALENREQGKMKNEKWYAFGRVQSLVMHDKPKLLTGVLANQSRFTYDEEGIFSFMGGGNAGGYGITLKSTDHENYYYILGLLNSKLLEFNLKQISSPFQGGFFSYARRYIELLPIYKIDYAIKDEKEKHDKLVYLVKMMLKLNNDLKISETGLDEWHDIRNKIKHLDDEIDNLVFNIYKLTQDEINIIHSEIK